MPRNRSVLYCAALALALMVSPHNASAQSNFSIRNPASGLVLDVVGASPADGQAVILFQRNNQRNQIFFQAVETDNTFSLVATHSFKCLDVAGFSQQDGAQVIQFACHQGTNQRWRSQRMGRGVILISVNSGKCLDARNGDFPFPPQSGTVLQQWACVSKATDANAVNQVFQLGGF
jgi:hypothetical protein